MNFGFEAIYDKIAEMINPKVIDSNLLMYIIGVTFRDIECLDNLEYYYLKGHWWNLIKIFWSSFTKLKVFTTKL